MNGSSCCVMQPIPISQSIVTTPAAAITNYMRLTITALEENLRYKNIPSYVSLSFLNELSNTIYSVNFTLLPFSSSFFHIILLQAVFLVKFPRPCYEPRDLLRPENLSTKLRYVKAVLEGRFWCPLNCGTK